MRILTVTILFLTCSVYPCLAQTASFPMISECEVITLHTSQGWWLHVRADGSGVYGFGTLLDRVEVKERTFDFKQIHSNAKKAAVEQRVNAEAPYVTISCFATGKDSYREFYLLDEAPIFDLFRTARMNSTKPKNEIEERWHNKIDDFWKRHPLFPDGGAPPAGAGGSSQQRDIPQR
jgi:hypothetical protein